MLKIRLKTSGQLTKKLFKLLFYKYILDTVCNVVYFLSFNNVFKPKA